MWPQTSWTQKPPEVSQDRRAGLQLWSQPSGLCCVGAASFDDSMSSENKAARLGLCNWSPERDRASPPVRLGGRPGAPRRCSRPPHSSEGSSQADTSVWPVPSHPV